MSELEEKIDNLLTYMTCSVPDSSGINCVKDLGFFKGAEPFYESTFQQAHSNSENRVFFTDVEPRDLNNSMDISLISKEIRGEGLALQRVRLLTPKDVRGKVQYAMPHFFERTAAIIDKYHANFFSVREYVGYDGVRWRVCGPTEHGNLGRYYFEEKEDGLEEYSSASQIRIAMGIAFTRLSEWRVELGYVGCPTVSLTTDPLGAREVFKLRDIPEGKTRREAIRHWVREHWRKVRETEIGVKAHLRGVERFVWNDLICVIRPSADDLKKAKEAKSPKKKGK